jgi:hypothetical protein
MQNLEGWTALGEVLGTTPAGAREIVKNVLLVMQQTLHAGGKRYVVPGVGVFRLAEAREETIQEKPLISRRMIFRDSWTERTTGGTKIASEKDRSSIDRIDYRLGYSVRTRAATRNPG